MANEGRSGFPDWVNTLVNSALTGCVVLVLVTVMDLRDKITILEQSTMSMKMMATKDLQLMKQEQKSKDDSQDMAIGALERRISLLEEVKYDVPSSEK